MLQEAIAPVEFIEWAKPRIIGLPKDLIEAVETFDKSLEKPKSSILSKNMKENMQVTICLLAAKHLGYQPNKSNSAATKIIDCFEKVGGEISYNTVRDYMKDGFKVLESKGYCLTDLK